MLDKPTFTWCDETVALLRSAISNNLTASETASALGERYRKAPTRAAILGKAWRLGLSFGESHGKRSGVTAIEKLTGHRGFPWTPRAVETFRELVALGLTSSEIIIRMGDIFHAAPRLSRSAVQQRASILGISIGGGKKRRAGSPSTIPAPMAAAPSRPVQDSGRDDVLPIVPAAPPFDGGGVSLLDLQFGMCRWIEGNPRDIDEHRYCGAQARVGESLCSHHHRIAYVPAKDRQRTKAQEEADDRRRQSAMRHWASGLRASGRSARL